MCLQFMPIAESDREQYIKDMQEAFLLGAMEGGFPPDTREILPESDIDRSLNACGAVAYKAMLNGEMVGGAILVLDRKKRYGHLDFLYVKHAFQNRGIGAFLWFAIERLHPDIRVWETCTPCFEKRNLHFYVNVCHFHVTDYWNARHPDPGAPLLAAEDGEEAEDGMFGFRKEIRAQDRKIPTPVYLETERLVIRMYREKDFPAYYRLIANPRVNCFRNPECGSMEEVRREFMEKIRSSDASELAVVQKSTDTFMGLLFGGYEENEDTFGVGWNFLPEYGKKGYAYEAAKAYFSFLFNELAIRRITAFTEDDNLPSQRLCEKLGMRREGLFREFISFVNNPDGSPHYENTYTWAILKKEWEKQFLPDEGLPSPIA